MRAHTGTSGHRNTQTSLVGQSQSFKSVPICTVVPVQLWASHNFWSSTKELGGVRVILHLGVMGHAWPEAHFTQVSYHGVGMGVVTSWG